MEIIFFEDAIKDLEFWKQSGNKIIQKKIGKVLASMIETPFSEVGNPEALKYDLSGKWSRRISSSDRIIY